MIPSRARLLALPALLALALPAAAQEEEGGERGIEVSGFFVEEAYNQEAGMLQQIARATWTRQGAWSADFTQEWPVFSERHQLDLSGRFGQHDGFRGLGAEYRFMALGGEDARLTLSPGVGVSWSREEGPGGAEDEWELEAALPASLRLGEGVTLNSGVEVSYDPGADDDAFGVSVGEALVWRAHPRLNLLVEAMWSRGEGVLGGGEDGEESLVVAPGAQVAFALGRRTQLVPGVAFPIGMGASSGERGVMAYLSIEHPIGR